ncbi:hypothetical protein GGF31_003814 [Allomyces arbusculus]|nr:hypothetical protein GGF31_003814 [Allomyces arbusculus]
MPVSAPSTRSSSSASLDSGPTAGAPHLVAASSPALGSASGRKPRRNLAKQTAQRCRLIEEKQRAMVAEQEATRERILRERKEKYRQVVLATKPDWSAIGVPKRRSEEAPPGGADQEPWDQRWPMRDPAPTPARKGVPASAPVERTPKIKYKGTWDPQQQLRVARASAVEVVKPRAEPSSHLASAYTSRSPSPAPPPDSPLTRAPRPHPPRAPTPPGPPATAPSAIAPAFGPSPTLPAFDPADDFSDSSMSDGDDCVSGSGGHRRNTLRLSEAAIRLLESNVKMKVSQAKAMMLGANGPAGAPPGGVGSAPRLLQPLPPEKQRSRTPSPPAYGARNGSSAAGRPKSARRVGGGNGTAATATKSRIGGGEERSRTVSRIPLASGDNGGVRRPSAAMARRWAHSDSLLYSGSTARAADEFGDVVMASTATKLDSAIPPEPDALESQLIASLERLTVEIDARLARVGLLHPTPSVFLRGVPRPAGSVGAAHGGWPTVGRRVE